MAISTCAFPSFYMFCSYSKNISSNQLLHRFHSNTRKHELTGGSKSRKQVEIKHAISTHRTSTATFHIYCACQIRRKISQDQNALKRFHKSCDQGFNCGFWIFKRVYIHLPKRRVSPPTIRLPWQSPCPNVPPAPSTCHDHLAFFIGKVCYLGTEGKPRNAATVWICNGLQLPCMMFFEVIQYEASNKLMI